MMKWEFYIISSCALVTIFYCLGFLCGLLLAMWRMDARSTGRYPSMPAGEKPERFQAQSQVKPYKRHPDMMNGDSLKKFHEDNEA